MGLSGPYNWTQPFCSSCYSGFCSYPIMKWTYLLINRRPYSRTAKVKTCHQILLNWRNAQDAQAALSELGSWLVGLQPLTDGLCWASLPPGRRLLTASGPGADAAPGAAATAEKFSPEHIRLPRYHLQLRLQCPDQTSPRLGRGPQTAGPSATTGKSVAFAEEDPCRWSWECLVETGGGGG